MKKISLAIILLSLFTSNAFADHCPSGLCPAVQYSQEDWNRAYSRDAYINQVNPVVTTTTTTVVTYPVYSVYNHNNHQGNTNTNINVSPYNGNISITKQFKHGSITINKFLWR